MYKFNLLKKINQEKQKSQKINHIVNLVFYSAAVISIVLILLMVGKSLIVGNSYTDYKQKYDDIVKKSDNLHNNKGFLSNDKIRRLYEFQSKRVFWTELLGSLESNMDSLSALEELTFNGSQIECKVLVKVDQTENNKAAVMKIMTGYQSRLSKDSLFLSCLKEKSDKDIIVAEQPNLNQEASNVWYYRLQFNVKDIVKPVSAAGSETNSKRRF